jgi:hypothetical protein
LLHYFCPRTLDRPLLPGHGYPLQTIQKAEQRLGVRLPQALRDYYLKVGWHRLNRIHNRRLSPKNIFVDNGCLVFMEENQVVVY